MEVAVVTARGISEVSRLLGGEAGPLNILEMLVEVAWGLGQNSWFASVEKHTDSANLRTRRFIFPRARCASEGPFSGGVGREGGALIRRDTDSYDQHVPDLGLARLCGAAQPDAAGSVARHEAGARGRSRFTLWLAWRLARVSTERWRPWGV